MSGSISSTRSTSTVGRMLIYEVEEAIARLFGPDCQKPPLELLSRIERLLDLDRSIGRKLRSKDPEAANFGFFSEVCDLDAARVTSSQQFHRKRLNSRRPWMATNDARCRGANLRFGLSMRHEANAPARATNCAAYVRHKVAGIMVALDLRTTSSCNIAILAERSQNDQMFSMRTAACK